MSNELRKAALAVVNGARGPLDAMLEDMSEREVAAAIIGDSRRWQDELADALDCFWNPAIGSSREGGDPVSSIAIGLSAIAQRLREKST